MDFLLRIFAVKKDIERVSDGSWAQECASLHILGLRV